MDAAALAAALLQGCTSEDVPPGLDLTYAPDLLSRSYFTSLAPIAEAASRLATLDPRYTRQLQRVGSYVLGGQSVSVSGSALTAAGVHYAHAAGLSGAGQTVAISDAGFITAHDTLSGKSITLGASPGVDGHGTLVASVVAGNSPDMVGLAPGASLILGNFGTMDQLAEVATLAREAGAVALNNSWTFPGLGANPADYQAVFGTSGGAAYLSALKSYAGAGGVAVWAAPNELAPAGVGIMAGLPALERGLEPAWLAVVNGLPTLDGDDVVGARRLSSPCLEAAAWCVAADGSWVAAGDAGVSAYQFATGTSFAAATVSGALALLGEAFPDLTPQQLRVRLLASADNDFAGFTKSGAVELVPGFSHDVSEEWGHGFLDVAAALMPIGQTSLATASGAAYPTSQPLAVETPATGDAVARALSGVDLLGRDALGAGFAVEAPSLVAARVPARLHASDVYDLAAGYSPGGYRATFLTGPTAQARTGDGTLLGATLPRGGGPESYGLTASRDLPTAFGAVSLSAGAGYDGGALLPTLFGGAGAPLAFAGIGASLELGGGLALRVSASGAAAGGATLDMASLELSARDPLGLGGALTLGLARPPAVTSGTATLTLPVRAASGAEEFRDFELGLVPAARELRLSASYGLPLGRGVDATLSLEFVRDRGNVAGRSEASALLRLVARF